jgi:hypothetical protein
MVSGIEKPGGPEGRPGTRFRRRGSGAQEAIHANISATPFCHNLRLVELDGGPVPAARVRINSSAQTFRCHRGQRWSPVYQASGLPPGS